MSNQPVLDINYDLSKAKTSLPLIVDGHSGKVKVANVTFNQVQDKGPQIKFEFHMVDPAPTKDPSKPVQAGFPVFASVPLWLAWGPDKVAKYVDAFLGTGDEGNDKGKPVRPAVNIGSQEGVAELASLLLGKEAWAKISVRKNNDYEGNDIAQLTNLADLQP